MIRDRLASGDDKYIHRDHLGSVEAVTDAAGALVRSLAYDPYGGCRAADWPGELDAAATESLADDLRESTSRSYTGHEALDRTGFVHMNGRVYDPQLGRFLSPDPVVQSPANSQSWNRYGYVRNSPMSFTDPSGYVAYDASGFCRQIAGCRSLTDSPAVGGSGSGFSTSVSVTTIQTSGITAYMNWVPTVEFVLTRRPPVFSSTRI